MAPNGRKRKRKAKGAFWLEPGSDRAVNKSDMMLQCLYLLAGVKREQCAEEKMEEEAGQCVLVGNLAQISMAACPVGNGGRLEM